jgi:phenylacetate-CoA ligase
LTRDDVQRAFGCKIIDNYGTQEIGYVAFECPAGGGYHVCAENLLVELLDDSGNDVADGERGRLVLTPFFNYAMPFIRYDIGDLAVAAQGPCSCGRTLPRLETILGRQRSIFTFPDGSQYSPWKWRKLFNAHVPAKQIQLVQTALDCIELRYIPQDGAAPPDPAFIEQIGRGGIHPMVLCRAVPVTEIPRMPSGKLEDCVSLVGSPPRSV